MKNNNVGLNNYTFALDYWSRESAQIIQNSLKISSRENQISHTWEIVSGQFNHIITILMYFIFILVYKSPTGLGMGFAGLDSQQGLDIGKTRQKRGISGDVVESTRFKRFSMVMKIFRKKFKYYKSWEKSFPFSK